MISAINRRPPILFKSGGDSPLRSGGGRDMVDVNSNNSPGHSSSQDGSFIQDEDMHLILEFGCLAPPANVIMQPQRIIDDRLQQQQQPHTCNDFSYPNVLKDGKSISDCCSMKVQASPPDDPAIFDNRRCDYRQRIEWAKKFDADIVAQLDFDDFSVRRDMALLNGDVTTKRKTLRFNNRRKILRAGDSMETSLLFNVNGECLSSLIFSSSSSSNCSAQAGDENENFFVDNGNLTILDDDFSTRQSDAPKEKSQPPGPFISTDSLDFSSLSLTEENLRQACATNKREYVLTFDKNAFESGLAIFSTETCMEDSYISPDNICLEIGGHCKNDNNGYEFSSRNFVSENQDKSEGNKDEDQCDCGISVISIGKTPEITEICNQSQTSEDNSNNNVVTWGRIKRSYEKPENSCIGFNPNSKFVSLPNLKKSNLLTNVAEEENHQPIDEETTTQKRLSLLQVFQENQQQQILHKNHDNESGYITGAGSNVNENFAVYDPPPPWNYFVTEKNFLAKECIQETNEKDFRYVDLNHNEIDYVPPFVVKDTTSEQKAPAKPPRSFVNQNICAQKLDSHIQPQSIKNEENEVVRNSLDLDFLKFPFEVPSLDMEITPFLTDFINNKIKKSNLASPFESPRSLAAQIFDGKPHNAPKLANNVNNLDDDYRIAAAGPGPEHIEDWDSLAFLLPNSVIISSTLMKIGFDRCQETDVDNAKSSGENWSIGAAVFDSLCPALECLLNDGLKPDKSICDVMKTSSDDITRSVCSLIAGVNTNTTSRVGGKTRERSMQFAVFVDGLLSSKSLNLWLEKLISDRKALDEIYARTSYVFYLSTKFCSNLTEKLTSNLKRLNNLQFDKIHLIDMDIDVDDHQQQHSKFSPGNRFSSLFRKSSSTKNQDENSLVLLQKELKIVFRFPAKIVLETKKKRNETKKNDRISPQIESRIPRNVSPSPSPAFRLDIRLQQSTKKSPSWSSPPPSAIPSPVRKKSSPSPSNSPTSKRSEQRQQQSFTSQQRQQQSFTSKIARFLKNSPSTPTKTPSRIPLPNNNNNNHNNVNYRLTTNLRKKL
uniref:RUN domain-containing protein n=1 Tax=Romanomermis culicivorax TaxID=13658 RepID=A0A915LC23_ROMCU